MAYHSGVRCWIGWMALGTLLGCSDFTSVESPTTGAPESTTGPASEGSSTGKSSTGVDSASGGGSTGDDSDDSDDSDDVGTTTGLDDPPDDGSTSTGASGEDASSGGAEVFPYAGDYTGTFSANCQIYVQGTLAVTVTPIGSAVGSATIEGQSTPLIGTVSETGVVSIDVTVAGVTCSIDGNLANDASGGSGTFNCPALACSGPWSVTGA